MFQNMTCSVSFRRSQPGYLGLTSGQPAAANKISETLWASRIEKPSLECPQGKVDLLSHPSELLQQVLVSQADKSLPGADILEK